VLEDRSFRLDDRDATFKHIDALVPADVGIVIAGHTHLERCIARSGGAQYINTGTWARLIELGDALTDSAAFAAVLAALQSKTLAELVAASPAVVAHRPAMASVETLPDRTAVQLRRIKADAGGVTWEEVKP
jgi:hypothetical protein